MTHLPILKKFDPFDVAEEIDRCVSGLLKVHPVTVKNRRIWVAVLEMVELKLNHVRKLIEEVE